MKTLSETFSDRQSKTFSNKQPKTFSNRQRILLLSALLACLALFSLSMGRYSNSPVDVINAIRSRLGLIPQSDISMENIVFYVRLPRILPQYSLVQCFPYQVPCIREHSETRWFLRPARGFIRGVCRSSGFHTSRVRNAAKTNFCIYRRYIGRGTHCDYTETVQKYF